MNYILLCGGEGKSLWPLSTKNKSKQFLKIFKDKEDKYISMIQRTYTGIKKVEKNANIIIATTENNAGKIKDQLGKDIDISIEPYLKDTFLAIALDSSYLYDIKKIDPNETIIVCPIDANFRDEYFKEIKNLSNMNNDYNIL